MGNPKILLIFVKDESDSRIHHAIEENTKEETFNEDSKLIY